MSDFGMSEMQTMQKVFKISIKTSEIRLALALVKRNYCG
jgi:hypothetical protein